MYDDNCTITANSSTKYATEIPTSSEFPNYQNAIGNTNDYTQANNISNAFIVFGFDDTITHDITVTIYMANGDTADQTVRTDRSDQNGDLLTGDSNMGKLQYRQTRVYNHTPLQKHDCQVKIQIILE